MFKIFLTNLGKYNEGELVGKWLELPADEEEISATLKTIGIDGERYEESFITDCQIDIDGLKVGYYDGLDYLNDLAESVENMDDSEKEIFSALLKNGYERHEAAALLDDCILYDGCDDMEEVAEQYADETGLLESVPEDLRGYFDFAAYGRDMELEATFIKTESGYVEVCA